MLSTGQIGVVDMGKFTLWPPYLGPLSMVISVSRCELRGCAQRYRTVWSMRGIQAVLGRPSGWDHDPSSSRCGWELRPCCVLNVHAEHGYFQVHASDRSAAG